MKKIILTILFCILSISFVFAETKISDIKVEGLQRVDPGLVFNNLPFEINDPLESINFSKAISILYKTGQFKDISIEQEGSIIIVSVRERPLIFEINFSGTEMFQPEALKTALSQMNITSGLVFD